MPKLKREVQKTEEPKKSFVDTYWFEITVIGLLGLGIFLLLERLQIKAAVYEQVVRFLGSTWTAARSTGRALLNWLRDVETSDLVGFGLILVAAGLIVWKLRHRAFKRHPYISICPDCGADLHRIRCTVSHRAQEILLWLRITHYSCCKCPFRTAVWRKRSER